MSNENKKIYEFGSFKLDSAEHTLLQDGEIIPLTPKVFDTLLILIENNGRLVEKDELLKKVWADAIVEESNLAKNISILRKVLSQNGLKSPIIETVPKRGYRFVAPVKEIKAEKSSYITPESDLVQKTSKTKFAVVASLLTISTLAIGLYFYSNTYKANALTDKDVILLADFDNKTGEELFDGTLKLGLLTQLRQSPFLSIFPDEQARKTLEFMRRSKNERITRELAREICQRQGLKAYIFGTITKFESTYALSLEAVNSISGETFAITQVEAENKDKILQALSQASTEMRKKLGESLATIEKFDKPLEVTTKSLDAFKAYSLGLEHGNKGNISERISSHKRAIELDPEFALAYLELYTSYASLSKYDLAEKLLDKAYELRENVSEREKINIDEWYYAFNLQDSVKTIEVLKTGKSIYPRDDVFRADLGFEYTIIGEIERAIEEQEELFRLKLNITGSHYEGLMWVYMRDNRFEDVKKINKEAFQKGFDNSWYRDRLFRIGFIENDSEAMQKQIDWFKGRPNEFRMLNLQADAAAFQGKFREAQKFSRQAISIAKQNSNSQAQTHYTILHEIRQSIFGRCSKTQALKNSPIHLITTGYSSAFTPIALAQCGKFSAAESLINKLEEKYPQSTLGNGLWIPMFKAQIELEKDNPQEAIRLLENAKRFEWAAHAYFYPQFIKGQARLKLGENEKAKAEFQKILDNRGKGPLSVLYPLAQLGKARAMKDKHEYEKFFDYWKDADEDLEILIEAKREFENL